MTDSEWGYWGKEPPCVHLVALRNFLDENFLSVWAEHAEEPAGWVNVSCKVCGRTYEVTLRPPYEV